jgi:uncharacterized membrane protein
MRIVWHPETLEDLARIPGVKGRLIVATVLYAIAILFVMSGGARALILAVSLILLGTAVGLSGRKILDQEMQKRQGGIPPGALE